MGHWMKRPGKVALCIQEIARYKGMIEEFGRHMYEGTCIF